MPEFNSRVRDGYALPINIIIGLNRANLLYQYVVYQNFLATPFSRESSH